MIKFMKTSMNNNLSKRTNNNYNNYNKELFNSNKINKIPRRNRG